MEVPPDPHVPNAANLLINDQNKYKSMCICAHSSLWVMGGLSLSVYMGHLYSWASIVCLQIFITQELFNLLKRVNEDRQLPGFRLLNWHFFFSAMLFAYGRFLSKQLVNTVASDKLLYQLVSGLMKYQMVICYFLYIAGFMWFILTLKKKRYKYQFGQYAWTHMILFLVFAQSSFTVANIFEGIFWFLLPTSLIVINDVAAYFFGFFFGRRPLIKLSPQKTWEGFIGASFTTISFAFVLANVLGHFQWLTCPRKFPWKELPIMPVQWHALALGLFASIIAPFGGFFASGFKRAFKIKMVMAVFAYIYHQSFVVPQSVSIEMILDQILSNVTAEEQHDLFFQLRRIIGERQLGLH